VTKCAKIPFSGIVLPYFWYALVDILQTFVTSRSHNVILKLLFWLLLKFVLKLEYDKYNSDNLRVICTLCSVTVRQWLIGGRLQ